MLNRAPREDGMIDVERQAELQADAESRAAQDMARHLRATYEICGLCLEMSFVGSLRMEAGGVIAEVYQNRFNRCDECKKIRLLHPQIYDWVERVILGRAKR